MRVMKNLTARMVRAVRHEVNSACHSGTRAIADPESRNTGEMDSGLASFARAPE